MTSPRNPQLLYELLFETATEGMIIVNQEGEIELANSKAGEMFGYSVQELKNLNVDDLLPNHLRHLHEGYRKAYVENPHKRPMGLGYDLVGVRKNGTAFPLEISLNHYRDGGETKVMALIMDITQRKEQEEQIRTLNRDLEKRVEQRTHELQESQQLYNLISRRFPNGSINVLDPVFNYIFAEGEELQRYNLGSGQLVGKNYLSRLPQEVQPVMEERLTTVLNGQNLSFELEYRDQYYMINTVGLVDNTGRVNRILLVEQNITERKLSEERTKEALRKEMHLNELKSRFVSMASHEFRTPLSAVLSSLSLIEKYDQGGMQDKKEKHYGRIRNSVQQLTGILNDFLSLEKVEAGKVQVSISAFDLRTLLGDLIDQYTGIRTGRHIHLVYDGDSTIVSDQNMMRIVLSNLLSNALKYSAEGKNVTVRVDHRGEKVRIGIEDQGIGIPYEEQDNLFERFFRAKNALNYEGTGLGLHIVSKYLQLLGGEISFRSIPGQGTTFIIDIPNEHADEKDTTH